MLKYIMATIKLVANVTQYRAVRSFLTNVASMESSDIERFSASTDVSLNRTLVQVLVLPLCKRQFDIARLCYAKSQLSSTGSVRSKYT